jgi:hypothetical protein
LRELSRLLPAHEPDRRGTKAIASQEV